MAGIHGFFIFSLGTTHLVTVVQAYVGARQTGAFIWAIGGTPTEILVNAWNGKDFGSLSDCLKTLLEEIAGQVFKLI